MLSENGVPYFNDNNSVKAPEMFDLYINMEVGLPRVNEGELYHVTVKLRAINDNGKRWSLEHLTQSLTQIFMKYIILVERSKP